MTELLQQVSREQAGDLFQWVQAYFAEDGLIYNQDVESAVEELLANPQYGKVWFVMNNGEVVGYCVLTNGFDHEVGGRIAVVTDFYLKPSARNQGVGTKVLQVLMALGRSEGIRQLDLYVLNHNERARRLYERLGFRSPADRQVLSVSLQA